MSEQEQSEITLEAVKQELMALAREKETLAQRGPEWRGRRIEALQVLADILLRENGKKT